MSQRVTMRTVVDRFTTLKFVAARHAKSTDHHDYDGDLHDAAMRYVAAVNKVARARRDR